ncbi:hypothetical protein PIB30_036442 [Stylosanthes scabra]|uniref:Uncharacterized protein n=1 Tax=Stylosanthes scabra TaxID=79078 RepID=A0ABU6UC55_9FABA|nr:hypothetical protein [Stylosanthes scabra]
MSFRSSIPTQLAQVDRRCRRGCAGAWWGIVIGEGHVEAGLVVDGSERLVKVKGKVILQRGVARLKGLKGREPRLMRGWGMMGNWRCEDRARAMPWRGLGAVKGGLGCEKGGRGKGPRHSHAMEWCWRGQGKESEGEPRPNMVVAWWGCMEGCYDSSLFLTEQSSSANVFLHLFLIQTQASCNSIYLQNRISL